MIAPLNQTHADDLREQAALDRFAALGAQIERDATRPGRPKVAIDCAGTVAEQKTRLADETREFAETETKRIRAQEPLAESRRLASASDAAKAGRLDRAMLLPWRPKKRETPWKLEVV